MAKAIRKLRKKAMIAKRKIEEIATKESEWARASGMVEILKIGDDDIIRTVRCRLTRNDNLKQQAQSSPANEPEPARPAAASSEDVYPSDSDDSDAQSIHCEEEKTDSPECPQGTSDIIGVTPYTPFTRSMARLHQQPHRTPLATEDVYESDSDDDEPLSQVHKTIRCRLIAPKQHNCPESSSPAETRAISPTKNLHLRRSRGYPKKSPKKKVVKTSKAKKRKPAREITQEKHLNRLRSLIDEDLLVSIDCKLTGTTKNGRMHEASCQMIGRLLEDRNTASGDVNKLEKEVVDLKRKLADVKKALK